VTLRHGEKNKPDRYQAPDLPDSGQGAYGVNVLRKSPLAFGASVVLALSLWSGGGLLAQQTEPTAKAPTTGSTKPDPGKPAMEKSMPSSAPAATTTQTTGATNQSKTVKSMNDQEKSKVENTGK
jgi:hypothetical protein